MLNAVPLLKTARTTLSLNNYLLWIVMRSCRVAAPGDVSLLVDVETILSRLHSDNGALNSDLAIFKLSEGDVSVNVVSAEFRYGLMWYSLK